MIKVSKNLFIGAIFLIISFFFNTAIVSAGADYASTMVYVGTGGTCPSGYAGTYPNCIPPSCPSGYAGTYPNCIPPSCPSGYTGTPPNCIPPSSCPSDSPGTYPTCCPVGQPWNGTSCGGQVCPAGYNGTPPDCTLPTCPVGYIGTPPNCTLPTCPVGYNGTPPNCTLSTCPSGYTGTPPNCIPPEPLSGSLNPSSGSCTIPAGESSCLIYATWSTDGNPRPSTSDVRRGSNSLFSGDFGEGNLEVPYGGATFYLFHGLTNLDTDSLGASCGAGTWNDSTCSLVVPPTGVLNVQDCEIASGGSTCPMPISFNVSNTGNNASYVQNMLTGENVGGSGTVMSFTTLVPFGTHSFNLLENNNWLASDSGEAKCAAGTTRVGSICLGAGGYGLYLHDTQPPITGCPIKRGNSSCRIHLGWYITDDGSNRVGWIRQQIPNGNDQINLMLSNKSDGYETTSEQAAVGRYGDTTSSPLNGGITYTFYMHYYNQTPWSDALGRPMATLDYTPVCESGSTWNETICSSNTSTLSATNCTIPIGSSTCSSSVSWYVLNPVGSSSVTRTNPNVTVSTAHSGSNVSNAISGANNGHSTYFLYNNNVEVAPRVTVTARCITGSHWSLTSSTCVADSNASLTLTATKNQIVKGSSVSLNMNAVGVESCTASSSPAGSFTGSISGTLLGPFWPTKTTIYSVTCIPYLDTQAPLTATAKVIVKEKISEIEQ